MNLLQVILWNHLVTLCKRCTEQEHRSISSCVVSHELCMERDTVFLKNNNNYNGCYFDHHFESYCVVGQICTKNYAGHLF